MNKKLVSILILSMALSIQSSCFAKTVNDINKVNIQSSYKEENGVILLTLGEALNNIEKDNMEVNLLSKKVEVLNRQYDRDRQRALKLKANKATPNQYGGDAYAELKKQQLILPKRSAQNIDDAKQRRDERLNNLKFDMQRQYMNAFICEDDINNINLSVTNIDNQIAQTNAKIKQGQVSPDTGKQLEVQKSQIQSQVNELESQKQQSLLKIKQYLNIDLNKEIKLVDAKRNFSKFDDSSLENKINDSINKNYDLTKINTNIEITKEERDIYAQYCTDFIDGETNAELNLKDLENNLSETKLNLQIGLKNKYYDLKNKEDGVNTQVVTLESCQINYDSMKHKFDLGLVDKVQLDSVKLSLDKQKNLYQRAINEYMVTQEEFIYLLEGHTPSLSLT